MGWLVYCTLAGLFACMKEGLPAQEQACGSNLRAEATPDSQLRDTGLVLGYAHAQRVCLREHEVRMFRQTSANESCLLQPQGTLVPFLPNWVYI